MTWTHAALVDRRRSVHSTGNSAAGEPEIPNRTRPRMSFGSHKRQIHGKPSVCVCVITLYLGDFPSAQLGKARSTAMELAWSGSIVELLNPRTFDRLPDHESSSGTQTGTKNCTNSFAAGPSVSLVTYRPPDRSGAGTVRGGPATPEVYGD